MMVECRRGRERDADVARRVIFAHAEEHFARYGFAGARMDKIAEDAGYNKSLLFHYFQDKQSLYVATVRHMRERVESDLAEALAPFFDDETAARDPARVRAFFETSIRWAFDFFEANPNAQRILSWEAAEGWATFTQLQPQLASAAWAQAPMRFIRQAQAAGTVRASLDPALLIAFVTTLTQSYHASIPRFALLFAPRDLASASALRAAREQMVSVVLHGAMRALKEPAHAAGV